MPKVRQSLELALQPIRSDYKGADHIQEFMSLDHDPKRATYDSDGRICCARHHIEAVAREVFKG